MRGARVIGTTSTEEKAALSRGAGADDIILYTERDFEAEVLRLTDGQGVEVVYDSVAQATLGEKHQLPQAARLYGLFWQCQRPVPPIDPLILSQKDLFISRARRSIATRRPAKNISSAPTR